MSSRVPTKVLVVSDTHGDNFTLPTQPADVGIHCGDLTEESKLAEFRDAIRLMTSINAPLKLIIAGNHDFTLDGPVFQRKLADLRRSSDTDNKALIKREYGDFGEARALFETEAAKADGIRFLDEGTHTFNLIGGARLTVYASPYTPSTNDWAFSYNPQCRHDWLSGEADIVVTHGPPRGIFDYTDARMRAGDQDLFAAVARTRPQLHCFGHIHESWGARLVTWKDNPTDSPSHLTDIANERSRLIESRAGLAMGKYDSPEDRQRKESKRTEIEERGYCESTVLPDVKQQTVFVNAALQGGEEGHQVPWFVDISLPRWRGDIDEQTSAVEV